MQHQYVPPSPAEEERHIAKPLFIRRGNIISSVHTTGMALEFAFVLLWWFILVFFMYIFALH